MSKLNCPLLKSKSANQASKKQVFIGILIGLTMGLAASLSIESSAIASLAHKETELVAIHAIAEAIQAEKATIAVADSQNGGSLAAL